MKRYHYLSFAQLNTLRRIESGAPARMRDLTRDILLAQGLIDEQLKLTPSGKEALDQNRRRNRKRRQWTHEP